MITQLEDAHGLMNFQEMIQDHTVDNRKTLSMTIENLNC